MKEYLDISDFENPKGIVTSVGGQTANNLTPKLAENGINLIGTSAELMLTEQKIVPKFSADIR